MSIRMFKPSNRRPETLLENGLSFVLFALLMVGMMYGIIHVLNCASTHSIL